MAALEVIWSNKAKGQLKSVHDYIKNTLKSPQAARNVKRDILNTSKSIVFAEQYEVDEIQPETEECWCVIIKSFTKKTKEEYIF